MSKNPGRFLAIVLCVTAAQSDGIAQCGVDWTVTFELSAKQDIVIDPSRLFHGPAAVVLHNGDWLVANQDSTDHSGRDGVISQARSVDNGKTWNRDGIVYDGRKDGYFGRNPAYGMTPDGLLVLVVQRWKPLAPGEKYIIGKEEGIVGSVYLISRDNGKSYESHGMVDPQKPLRHQGTTSNIYWYDGRLYMPAISIGVLPRGAALYTTEDPRKGWRFDGWIFRFDQLPPSKLGYAYPTLIRRSDGSLLAQIVSGDRNARNFQSISRDMGKTWSPPRELKDLRLGWNTDLDYGAGVLVVHGRAQDANSYAVYFSPDEGESWGCPIVLDRYGFRGWGGYGASLRTPDGNLFVFFSTDAGPRTGKDGGKPDIRGVLLSDVEIRRPLPGRDR